MHIRQRLSSVTAKVGRHQIELYLGHVSMYKHHFIYRMYDVQLETELPVCMCVYGVYWKNCAIIIIISLYVHLRCFLVQYIQCITNAWWLYSTQRYNLDIYLNILFFEVIKLYCVMNKVALQKYCFVLPDITHVHHGDRGREGLSGGATGGGSMKVFFLSHSLTCTMNVHQLMIITHSQ